MGDGEGERVRSIELRGAVEAEQHANDLGDLTFVGASLARHRSLHARRRILGDRDARARKTEQDDAASVPELRRRLSVLVKEDRLDRTRVGTEATDDVRKLRLDDREPIRE